MTPSAPVLAPPPQPVPFVPDSRAELPTSAEVVVVGGGMLGASAAYHLARAGMRPLVIEANSPAWGASGRNAGMALAGLGGHFERVSGLVQESGGRSILDYTMRSLDMLEAWDAELPGGIDWDRFGSLDLATDEDDEDLIRRTAWLQAGEGLEVRIVSGAELDDLGAGAGRGHRSVSEVDAPGRQPQPVPTLPRAARRRASRRGNRRDRRAG